MPEGIGPGLRHLWDSPASGHPPVADARRPQRDGGGRAGADNERTLQPHPATRWWDCAGGSGGVVEPEVGVQELPRAAHRVV